MQTSISKILSQTGTVLGSRLAPMLGLWATFFAAQIGLFVALISLVSLSSLTTFAAGSPESLTGGVIGGLLITYLVYFIVAFAQAGALVAIASPLQKLTFGEAIQAGFRSALPMLGVLVILLVLYFIVAIVLSFAAAALAALGQAGVMLAGLLTLVGLIYFICRLCLVHAVIAVDRVSNPITAIMRGWEMTGRNVLTIVGVILLLAVILIVGVLLLFIPFYSVLGAAFGGGAVDQPGFGTFGLMIVGFLVLSAAFAIISAALFAVMHAQLSGSSAEAASDVFS